MGEVTDRLVVAKEDVASLCVGEEMRDGLGRVARRDEERDIACADDTDDEGEGRDGIC